MPNVTKVHLIDDLKDLAETAGFGDQLETRFARAALGSKEGALGFQRIKPNQRQTLRSLGLKRINHTVVKEDRPEIRGMVATVPHLVTVEEIS